MRSAATMETKQRIAKAPTSSFTAPVTAAPPAKASVVDPDAIDIGRMRLEELKRKLSKEERERQERDQLCMNCARPNHRAIQCRSSFRAVKPTPYVPRVAFTSTTLSTAAMSSAAVSALSNETAMQLIQALKLMSQQLPGSASGSEEKGKAPEAGSSSGF